MIRFAEAFERAKRLGIVKGKRDFAMEIWPESSPVSAYTNLRNLQAGQTKSIGIDKAVQISKRLEVSLDYLFGVSEYARYEEYAREKAKEIISIAQSI